ncbi:response regulator [Emcibacter sp.]|uniref:response regulator n=1 Tax=Emcibacter sp. TaxID=1979954 RepID=UPI003A8CB814
MSMKTSQPILLIEDSDDDYEATLRALKKGGNLANPVFRCEHGEEAMDFLMAKGEFEDRKDAPKPGIILLDLNLPGKDGKKILSEIRADPSTHHIPVIILTTSDNEKDVEECYVLGANTFIQKPVKLDSFMDAINHLKEYWLEVAILPKGGGA